jgi:glutathione S-transferase
MVGDMFTIADVAVPSFFVNASMVGYKVDAARWQKLGEYLARAFAHPAWARRLAAEAAPA